jgi:hypothetical protein
MILAVWTFVIASALAFRFVSSKRRSAEAVALIASDKGLPLHLFDAETYNYLRGDIRIDLKSPPFQDLTWTVNIRTHQILSWQSKKREDSVLQSLLKNFSDPVK